MGFSGVIFFGFLAAVIIVPQLLRSQERQRLHDTIRASLAKGQPVPPEMWQALRWRRRVYAADYDAYGQPYTATYDAHPGAYAPPPGAPPPPPSEASSPLGEAFAAPPHGQPTPPSAPLFVGRSLVERDLRRGVVWLAIGFGLIAAGAAFYAGLYYDGGAPEVFSSFAALGAIPAFVGLTYLALWFFGRKSKV